MNKNNVLDKISKYTFLLCAVFGIFAICVIALFILVNSIPAFRDIGFFKFLFGDVWSLKKGEFGIAPMIVGSIYITAGAILIGVTIGLLSAIFISKFAPAKLKRIIKTGVNLLSGIPSVVYGFFGMKFIVPMLTDMSGTNADGILASSIILGIMILPTVISISVNSLDAVPHSYYEGAVALGATKEQAIFKIVVPAAKSGIMTSVILGIGRALGETMAVIMVAGNSPVFPDGIFSSIRTMTGNVVLEMAYAENGSTHMSAIVATGFVLMVFVMIINICLGLFNTKRGNSRNAKHSKGLIAKLRGAKPLEPPIYMSMSGGVSDQAECVTDCYNSVAISFTPRNRAGLFKAAKYLSLSSTMIALVSLISIIVFIFVNGIPYITIDFLFNPKAEITILPALVSTLMLIFMSLLIALPIGICAAIYLNEYTKAGSKLVRVIRVATETLSGVPSIVFGLFGMLFFRSTLGMGYSLMAGSLTLTLMILPTIIRTTEESLSCIPMSFREASMALGASKTRTLFKVVIPSALSGILNAVILSIGRIIGESAALIFTSGSNRDMPSGYGNSGGSLTVMLYMLTSEGRHMGEAFAVAVVLIVLVVLINTISEIIDKRYSKKVGEYA